MLATIRDDTWNMLNMQRITPNSKRWDYSDIPGGGTENIKNPPTRLKVTTTLEKTPTPTYVLHLSMLCYIKINTNVSPCHDDVTKLKHFPRYWAFVRESIGRRWIPFAMASKAELQ